MEFKARNLLSAVAWLGAMAGLHPDGAAAAYPERPIRVVVPVAAGGTADIVTRLIAQRMSESIGQQIVVDNQPGAATMVGIEAAKRAPADGYTILFGTTSFGLNLVTRKNVRYRLEDFTPVSLVMTTPYAIITSPSVPARTLSEFISYAKANPAKVNYGTLGVGGSQHLLGEIFNRVAGIEMTPIAYQGSAPVLAALMGGQVQLYFDVLFTSVPQHRQKKLVLLAATTKDRVDIAPDIPTAAELGFPDLTVSAWLGFIARAETPKAIVQQLNQEIVKAVANPVVQKRIIETGNVPSTGSPEAFDAVIKADMDRWGRIARALKIELE